MTTDKPTPAPRPWTRLSDKQPPNGTPVQTKIHNAEGERMIQTLARQNWQWLNPETGQEVHHKPTHWRPLI